MSTLIDTEQAGARIPGRPAARNDLSPIASSCGVGLIASLCCGGSIVFASIGLGAFYSSLGLARYVPQALLIGSALIVAVNWLYYRRKVRGSGRADALHRTMVVSTEIGLVFMVVAFVFLDWLNHGVVNYAAHVKRPEYANALIPFVKDTNLIWALFSFGVGSALISLLPLSGAPLRRTEALSAGKA